MLRERAPVNQLARRELCPRSSGLDSLDPGLLANDPIAHLSPASLTTTQRLAS
jgi:hypothetical protein